MADINATISKITLNVNDLNTPIKRDYQSGSKNKAWIYVVYKKHTLDINTHID